MIATCVIACLDPEVTAELPEKRVRMCEVAKPSPPGSRGCWVGEGCSAQKVHASAFWSTVASDAHGGGMSNAAFGRTSVGDDGAVESRLLSGPSRCKLGAGCAGPKPVLQTPSVDRVPSLGG